MYNLSNEIKLREVKVGCSVATVNECNIDFEDVLTEDLKIAVYTVITKGYDKLVEPKEAYKDCDYICFTNDQNLRSDTWNIKPLPQFNGNPKRDSRLPKILPHLFLKEYELSIYIDGNILITGVLVTLAKYLLRKNSIVFFQHPEKRSSVYEEAEACIRLHKDKKEIIQEQINKYRWLGIPRFEIPMCGIIMRRHNDSNVKRLMQVWWEEFINYSQRDQISFPYAAWQNGLKYIMVSEISRDNMYFRIVKHNKQEKNTLLNSLIRLYKTN